jgi:quercetin dioxygenase-like cupin family protein
MAVSAPSANNVPGAARLGHRDVRGASAVLAGTFPFEAGDESVTGWHFHDLHQLEYAFEGVAQVETDTARYLLPPQQAVWIPADVEHCTTLTRVKPCPSSSTRLWEYRRGTESASWPFHP